MEGYEISAALAILKEHFKKHYENQQPPERWCTLPEIPIKEEIMPKADFDRSQVHEEWNDYQKDPVYDPSLPINIVDGPWPNKMAYLGAHYQILREDAIAPLRTSVDYFRQHQHLEDTEDTHVYTSVHIKGLNMSALGVAFRVTFSTDRGGKRIRWDNSKRLTPGTIVALSPERDMFGSICKVAIVAGRPMSGLEVDPPEAEIFWGDIADAVIDPSECRMIGLLLQI
jgi:helicase required for RNAi-mediated heterochromatin assembly 1